MKKDFYRVYVVKNGKAYQTPYLADKTEPMPNIRSSAVKTTKGYDVKKAIAKGCPVLTPAAYNNFLNLLNNDSMKSQFLNNVPTDAKGTTFDVAANAMGRGQTVFQNVTHNRNATRQVFRVVLSNPTANAVETVLGDHNGTIADKKGLATLPAAVIVGGSWGTNTLAMLKQMTGTTSVLASGLHITSETLTVDANGAITGRTASNSFFSAGQINEAIGSFTNQSLYENNIVLSDTTDSGTFSDGIRKLGTDEWEWFLNAMSGLPVQLPSLTAVTITFGVKLIDNVGTLTPITY